MDWKHLLACITGSVDQALLLRHEYLITENRILRRQISDRVRLGDEERQTLAEIGKQLGKQALDEVATIVTPETILAWRRRFVAKKFDGSKQHEAPGRPKIDQELEALVVRLAQGHRAWGDDRIVGALKHLGYTLSDQIWLEDGFQEADLERRSGGDGDDGDAHGVSGGRAHRPALRSANAVPAGDPGRSGDDSRGAGAG
jgi:Homeodomain-like domain